MKKQFWAKLLVVAMVLTMLPVAALAADVWSKDSNNVWGMTAVDGAYTLSDDTLPEGTYAIGPDAAADASLTLYSIALDAKADLTIKGVKLVPPADKNGVFFTVKAGAKLTLDGVSADKGVYLISSDADNNAISLKGTFANNKVYGSKDAGATWSTISVSATSATTWPTSSSTPGGGSGAPASPNSGSTSVVENEDGSTTTTMTTNAGTGVTTVPAEDGEGVTTAEVELKSSAVNKAVRTGDPVELPVPALTATADSATAPVVKVTVPASVASKNFKVAVPVAGDAVTGVVPVVVDADGNEEVVKVSMTEDGKLVFAVEGNTTVKLVDKSVAFTDVGGHWAKDAVDFASSRELFKGTSATTFAPGTAMTRSMMATVLYRLANEPEAAAEGISFEDVADGTWYTEAAAWAEETGIVKGQSEGVFAPEKDITRGELVTMIYRYAQHFEVAGETAKLDDFSDAADVQDWAADAMAWCVGSGILNGRTQADGTAVLAVGETAQRAEVATVLQRLVAQILK